MSFQNGMNARVFTLIVQVTLASLFCFNNSAVAQGQAPPTGLVSRWLADGNANDTENLNNGTLQNGATFAPGKIGSAFSFDGRDDVVLIPHSSSLNLASSHTIAAWAFRTSTASIQHLVGKRVGCGGDKNFIQLAIAGDAIPSAALPLNTWNHVAITYNGSSASNYVNGVVVNTSVATLGNNTAPLLIGSSGTCAPFAGLMDDVQIYNRALTQLEIQAIMQPIPAITTISVPTLQIGQPSTFKFDVAPGQPPYTWSLASGTLPPGMVLSSDGTLAGTPAQAGEFTCSIRVLDSAGATATRTFTVVVINPIPSPTINPGGAVNGASFAPGGSLVPGSIASVFGNNFLSAGAGGTTLRVNGVAAPIFAVGQQQINFQVPLELSGQPQASLTVTREGITSSPLVINLAPFGPGLFSTNATGSGQGAILIANTASLVAPSGTLPGSRPAQRGEFISIYSTGLGAVTNPPGTGIRAPGIPPSVTTTEPTVIIGGAFAQVVFSGLAPSFFGLYQVNVQIPANAPTGNAIPVVLTIGGVSSNTVTIAIQ